MTEPDSLLDGEHLLSQFFKIELKEANRATDFVWDTSGIDAADAAFWRVTPSAGFFVLGDVISRARDADDWVLPHAFTLSPRPEYADQNLLVKPVGTEEIWNDAGDGKRDWLHVYRVIAPEGYVALGDVITGRDNAPDFDRVRCIKKTAKDADGKPVNLVTPAQYMNFAAAGTSDLVPYWTDAHSGADKDVAAWLMQVTERPAVDEVYLVPGTFRASRDYGSLPKGEAHALVLGFPQADILDKPAMDDKRARLTGSHLPTAVELAATRVVDTYELPFFAVRDPNYPSQLDQFRGSRVYTVTRTTEYEAIDSFAPINTETKEYAVTVGTSHETNYSNEAGIALGVSTEIGGEAGIAVGKTSIKITASVEVSYSHTWGGATSKSEEKSYTYPQTVTGGSFGALFQAKSRYVITRMDGTRVGSPVDVKVNELYTDEWPRPGVHAVAEASGAPEVITFTIDAPRGKTIILEGRLEIRDGAVTAVPSVTTLTASAQAPDGPPPGRTLAFASGAAPIEVPAGITASYTKEAWIRLPSGPVTDQNIVSGGNVAGRHAFWVRNGRVAAGHNSLWEQVADDAPVATATWEHHAVSYDATAKELRLYRDGRFIAKASAEPFEGDGLLTIGGHQGGPSFRGDLAQVRVWDHVRTPEQIAAQVHAAVPEGTAGLLYPRGAVQ